LFSKFRKKIKLFFESQGFNEGVKVLTVKVPPEILNSKDLWPYFLRGIFDSDGCIYFERNYSPGVVHKQRRRARMEITSVSEVLIDNLQEMCLELGYSPKMRSQHPSGKGKNISYRLRFNRKNDIIRWFKEISPRNNVHINRFKKWQELGHY